MVPGPYNSSPIWQPVDRDQVGVNSIPPCARVYGRSEPWAPAGGRELQKKHPGDIPGGLGRPPFPGIPRQHPGALGVNGGY